MACKQYQYEGKYWKGKILAGLVDYGTEYFGGMYSVMKNVSSDWLNKFH